jgi:hypothetical protein
MKQPKKGRLWLNADHVSGCVPSIVITSGRMTLAVVSRTNGVPMARCIIEPMMAGHSEH